MPPASRRLLEYISLHAVNVPSSKSGRADLTGTPYPSGTPRKNRCAYTSEDAATSRRHTLKSTRRLRRSTDAECSVFLVRRIRPDRLDRPGDEVRRIRT